MFPKLIQERHSMSVPVWPKVHIWANGTVIVEEMTHVLIWDSGEISWRRYEWAALSDFPKAQHYLEGAEAIKYILDITGDFET